MIVSDQEYAALKEFAQRFIAKYCIEYGDMPGKMPGSRYTWMFYLRRASLNPDVAFALSKMFLYHMERMDPKFNFQICGMDSAGVPLITALSLSARYFDVYLNAISCRKERKAYGLLNRFEGMPENKLTVIMDDLCNSGKSMKQCLNSLLEENIPVASVAFCIVNKSNKTHSEERRRSDMYLPKEIHVVSLFTLDDFNLEHPSH